MKRKSGHAKRNPNPFFVAGSMDPVNQHVLRSDLSSTTTTRREKEQTKRGVFGTFEPDEIERPSAGTFGDVVRFDLGLEFGNERVVKEIDMDLLSQSILVKDVISNQKPPERSVSSPHNEFTRPLVAE